MKLVFFRTICQLYTVNIFFWGSILTNVQKRRNSLFQNVMQKVKSKPEIQSDVESVATESCTRKEPEDVSFATLFFLKTYCKGYYSDPHSYCLPQMKSSILPVSVHRVLPSYLYSWGVSFCPTPCYTYPYNGGVIFTPQYSDSQMSRVIFLITW